MDEQMWCRVYVNISYACKKKTCEKNTENRKEMS